MICLLILGTEPHRNCIGRKTSTKNIVPRTISALASTLWLQITTCQKIPIVSESPRSEASTWEKQMDLISSPR
ncbi:unnamed protein product [Allacma fusca]|uniref:Uncharacterized protein n=1 Tax=Allacma fusca TaxID=39272 RepID=A0A8J2K799_9HEXA|nr:unnamed protein product [Allacma fusca]